jgi:hypothetical protein
MRTTLSILATCLVLALSACGGDDNGEEDEFVAQVNAVCADYRPKLEHLQPPAGSSEEWAAIGADMGDLLEASVNELRLLQPPESLEEEYAEWLALRAEATEAVRDLSVAGGEHDEAAVAEAIARVDTAIAEADPLAEEAGFDECSPTGVTTGT